MAETVVVGCKLPNGIATQIGSKMVELQGPRNMIVQGVGYGLTHDVDKLAFDEWLKQHADQPYVKRGLIFASSREADARRQGEERKDEKAIAGLSQDAPAPGITRADEPK